MNAPAAHRNLDPMALLSTPHALPITRLPSSLRPMLLVIDAFVPNAIMRTVQTIRPNQDLENLAPTLLAWMLLDESYGLIRLAQRVDVRQALSLTADVLLHQIEGEAVPANVRVMAELRAESAQSAAWRAMKFRIGTTGTERVEWMIATAVLRSIDRFGISLAEALNCAMVAWGSPVPGRAEVPAPVLARAALEFLLTVLRDTQAPHFRDERAA